MKFSQEKWVEKWKSGTYKSNLDNAERILVSEMAHVSLFFNAELAAWVLCGREKEREKERKRKTERKKGWWKQVRRGEQKKKKNQRCDICLLFEKQKLLAKWKGKASHLDDGLTGLTDFLPDQTNLSHVCFPVPFFALFFFLVSISSCKHMGHVGKNDVLHLTFLEVHLANPKIKSFIVNVN